LTMRRIGTITGLVAVSALSVAAPALANDGWGGTNCSQFPSPACDLSAGTNPGNGRPGGTPGNGDSKPGRPGGDHPGSGDLGNPGDTIVGGDSNLAHCSYVQSDYQPPTGGVIAAVHTPSDNTSGNVVQVALSTRSTSRALAVRQPGHEPGAWYMWKCSEGVTDGLYRPPVWIPDGQQPGPALLPSPAEVAQMAHKQLRLPAPTISANPTGDQLVNLPTWMWLSSGWRPVSATASVPGVSVTATATPTSVIWAMGDGTTVTCNGAGTPYSAADPEAPSPDCGHVYRRSSASQSGQAFPVTATVYWIVSWSGAGQGGTFPDMTTAGSASFRVAESQALNSGGG
jgi:hypothetical protein